VYIHETAREEANNNGNSEINKIGGRLQIIKNVKFFFPINNLST
jgi:hypothetical protein